MLSSIGFDRIGEFDRRMDLALTRYFFFFFGLCAAHVSHNELSPPGLGRAFVSPGSELRRSVFEILKLSFRELMSMGLLRESHLIPLAGSLFIPLPAD